MNDQFTENQAPDSPVLPPALDTPKRDLVAPIVIAGVTVVTIIAAIFFWLFITIPRVEDKGTVSVVDTGVQGRQKKAEIVCGTPPEPLDTSRMEISEHVSSLVVNEWYIDRSNPQESFVELRNISPNTFVTDRIEITMNDPSLLGSFPTMSHGGVIPTQEIPPGCLMVLREKDITLRQSIKDISFQGSHSTGKIDGKFLEFRSRSGGGNAGQIEYPIAVPDGSSVSLTPAGKYIVAPKTPGAYNAAVARPSFTPSAAAVKYFKEIVPYIPSTSPQDLAIAKWERKEVPVYIGRNATEQDRVCIATAVQELRGLTGLVLPEKSVNQEHDLRSGLEESITILFIPPADSDLPEVSKRTGTGFARAIWYDNDEFRQGISYGEVYLSPTYSQQERCSLVYWGLGKAIGVIRKGTNQPTSIFNDVLPSVSGFGDIDKEIIRMLYDPVIEHGDTKKDIDQIYPG